MRVQKLSRGGTAFRIIGYLLAFALLVAGIESLQILVAWWQAGKPPPEWKEWTAFAVFVVAALAWWRHSVFSCRNNACLLPGKNVGDDDGRREHSRN